MARKDDWPTPWRKKEPPLHIPPEWFPPFVTALLGRRRAAYALRARKDQIGAPPRPPRAPRKADKAQGGPERPEATDKPPTGLLFGSGGKP